MKVDCLVCGKPTSATHMGMDACRACTVFYKRNHMNRDRLRCGYGKRTCMDATKNNVFNCRKCRIERFESVMRSGDVDLTSLENSDNINAEERLKGTPLTCKGPSIIDKIRVNHQALCVFRRNTEFNLRGVDIDPAEANDETYELIPSSYRLMNEGMKVLIVGLFEFASTTFPEFRSLSSSEKWLLIRNYHRCFFWMDGALRSMRRFGNKFDILFGSYTTKVSLDLIDQFFLDCPESANVSDAAKTFRNRWNETVPRARTVMELVNPSEDELLAIIALAFWSFENIETSEHLDDLATQYRSRITAELSAHYSRTIGDEKAAIRIGVVLCLLQQFKIVEMTLKSDYEMYHLLGAFDEQTLTYRLQVL